MSKPPSTSKAKNTTMKDVAALADVSLMTVSRVPDHIANRFRFSA